MQGIKGAINEEMGTSVLIQLSSSKCKLILNVTENFFFIDHHLYGFEVSFRIGAWCRGITFATLMSSQLLIHISTLINSMHTLTIYVFTWKCRRPDLCLIK